MLVNNSTNINKRNNHLSPQVIEHEKYPNIWHWKSRSWLGTQICDRVKLVNWMSTLPLLWWSSFLCFLQFFFSFTFTLEVQFPLQIWWSSVGHPLVHKASPGVLFSSVKMIVLETKILRIISIQLIQIDWNSYNFH